MTNDRLLAKSSRNPLAPELPETLEGHLRLVADVAQSIVDAVGPSLLASVGLAPDRLPSLREAVLRGAFLHDLGKANEQFQRMVRAPNRIPQALLHEVVGLWILAANPELRCWVFAGCEPDVEWAVIRAIAGHHVRFRPDNSLDPRSSGAAELAVLTGHSNFRAALTSLAEVLGIKGPPWPASQVLSLVEGMPEELVHLVTDGDRWWNGAGSATRRFAAIVAALVVASDVCGSAKWRDVKPSAWARSELARRPQAERFAAAATNGLRGKPPRPFQDEVAATESRLTLLTAGCGTGKTAAAYRWAATRLEGRRLFFCYPTTHTAFEGFNDYVLEEFEHDAALVSSRADLDIEFLSNARDGGDPLEFTIRRQALETWGSLCTVCTADTVLGITQNYRTSLFASPALLTAGYVFDEVHLYDDRMFGSLLAFLEAIRGVPILLMTATLQPSRKRALHELAVSQGEPITEIGGPADFEHLKRYRLGSADQDTALDSVRNTVARGGRALWVCNTVDRAIAVARMLEAEGMVVEPYHSRYRYGDRLDRHRAVMALFRAASGGAVAVTTQVCEVSLDISADFLVTELAPPPSLIQRLGRLNRFANPEDHGPPGLGLVVEPANPAPYEERGLSRGREWLSAVEGRDLSQLDLRESFERLVADEPTAQRTDSAWLEHGWVIERSSVREDGLTASFLREEDRTRCVGASGRAVGKEVTRFAIPMLVPPVAEEVISWSTLGSAIVAPAGRIEYSTRWGAAWRR